MGFVASAWLGRPERTWALGGAMLLAALFHLPAARTNPVAGGTAALLLAMAAARAVEATATSTAEALPTTFVIQGLGFVAFLAGVARARSA